MVKTTLLLNIELNNIYASEEVRFIDPHDILENHTFKKIVDEVQ